MKTKMTIDASKVNDLKLALGEFKRQNNKIELINLLAEELGAELLIDAMPRYLFRRENFTVTVERTHKKGKS